jgi:5'-nucleotidase/UDP-sugar diphosphatase
MKRFLARRAIWFLFLLAVGFDLPATAKEQTLLVLHTNDLHGHALKFRYEGAPDAGGLPAIATLVNELRSKYENVLVLDAGDLNTGMPESGLFKAVPDIIGLNYIGYDAMTLGNHEFDNPISVLKMQQRLASFPFLAANIKNRDGSHLVSPYIIKDLKGLRVGIFGLTLTETKRIANPGHTRDIIFEDEVITARQMVKLLRDKADVVVALVHMGIWQDDSRGSRTLASNVGGLDLIIDGHSHTDMTSPLLVNGTPIVQAFKWGLRLGKGVLTLRDKTVAGFQWESIPVNSGPGGTGPEGARKGIRHQEDPFLLSILAPFGEKASSILAEVVGYAEASLSAEEARRGESELGDLIADSMLWSLRDKGPDFALHNGGGIRASLAEGPITKRAVYEVLPFDNTLVVLKLKGSDLERLFDHIASLPKGSGAFPQVSKGISFVINQDKGRCENIILAKAPLSASRQYTIVTNSYLAAGGDGYGILLEAGAREDTSILLRDALADYISNKLKRVKPSKEGRITVIAGKGREETAVGRY